MRKISIPLVIFGGDSSGEQLGFGDMLDDTAQENAARAFEKETEHLPDTWARALAYHRQQITDHHAVMLWSDLETALSIRRESNLLAKKLNGGDVGILAGPEVPGCKIDSRRRS